MPREHVHATVFMYIQHQKDISGKYEHFIWSLQGLLKGSGLVLKVEFRFGSRLRFWKVAIRGLVVGVRVAIRGC